MLEEFDNLLDTAIFRAIVFNNMHFLFQFCVVLIEDFQSFKMDIPCFITVAASDSFSSIL